MEWIKDKKWWGMALGRAIRTVAQSALAYIGTSATMMHEVNWLFVLSAGCFGGVVSLLTSIAVGMPEYKEENNGKE